ncbi:hypothetical protein HELRODRAFT_167574 [Helobdella robusta]|uniref:Uncharacterized protein n=1 Tax=Helobdella robusta TaxID=6412 RepID=T1EZI3_HELRO|nr:hypothetical protein HELRODRAFT_167574 [Helobdella robusta]ESO11052.1 hypothetical protein HELRODRAFT_167574 [Helobdella robusta]
MARIKKNYLVIVIPSPGVSGLPRLKCIPRETSSPAISYSSFVISIPDVLKQGWANYGTRVAREAILCGRRGFVRLKKIVIIKLIGLAGWCSGSEACMVSMLKLLAKLSTKLWQTASQNTISSGIMRDINLRDCGGIEGRKHKPVASVVAVKDANINV